MYFFSKKVWYIKKLLYLCIRNPIATSEIGAEETDYTSSEGSEARDNIARLKARARKRTSSRIPLRMDAEQVRESVGQPSVRWEYQKTDSL